MATKKQKRAIALEKRRKFEEEVRESGLEAQRKDREHRAKKAEQQAKPVGKKKSKRHDSVQANAKLHDLVANDEEVIDLTRKVGA